LIIGFTRGVLALQDNTVNRGRIALTIPLDAQVSSPLYRRNCVRGEERIAHLGEALRPIYKHQVCWLTVF